MASFPNTMAQSRLGQPTGPAPKRARGNRALRAVLQWECPPAPSTLCRNANQTKTHPQHPHFNRHISNRTKRRCLSSRRRCCWGRKIHRGHPGPFRNSAGSTTGFKRVSQSKRRYPGCRGLRPSRVRCAEPASPRRGGIREPLESPG